MARKGWQSLSSDYKARLERAGMSRADYEAGQSLAKARGHDQTPENPRAYDPTKYQKYHSERTRLETQLNSRKQQLFGQSDRWSDSKSKKNIREYPPSLAQIRWAVRASDDELLDAFRESPTEFSWLGYH